MRNRIKPLLILVVIMLALFLLVGCKTEVSDELPIYSVAETDGKDAEVSDIDTSDWQEQYIKFQDKMSMDWDSCDAFYLAKIAQYHDGDKYDRAYTIVVTLNRMLERVKNHCDDCSILSVVLEELYDNDGLNAYEFEGIVIDKVTVEAMELVVIEKYDPTMGSLEYIEFYK